MTAATLALSHRLRPFLAAICLGAIGALVSVPALARGPEGIADVAEKVIDAVVNISTSQTVEAKGDSKGAVPRARRSRSSSTTSSRTAGVRAARAAAAAIWRRTRPIRLVPASSSTPPASS